MQSITDFHFWIGLFGILIAFILAFYVPGRVLMGNLPISKLKVSHALSLVIGAVFWAWQGYIFGILHLRFLSYAYVLVFLGIFFVKGFHKSIDFKALKIRTIDPVILLLVGIGVFVQTFPYIRMGFASAQGMIVAAHNMEDHIWHAGLIREIISRFPADEPGMAGIGLKDYHYWFNLLTADLIRVFHLDPLQTQFIGMYILCAILLGIISYSFANYIYPSKTFTRLFIFLLFFSGDVAGWYLLLLKGTFNLNLSSLINNGTKFLDSPAFALSILVSFTAMYLLFYHKHLSKRLIILCAFLFSSLLEFKVYTGIIIMIGFGGYAAFSLYRRQYDRVIAFILACILGAMVFFPGTSSSGGLFFLPFEIPRDFATQSILGLRDWELRWRIYQEHSNYLRIAQYGIYMSAVYLFIQFGIQLIGLIPMRRLRIVLGADRYIFIYFSILSGLVMSLFFYQKVGGANIWEFLLCAGILLSFLASLMLTLFLEKRSKIVTIISVVVIAGLILPRWFDTVSIYVREEYLSGFHGVDAPTYDSYIYLKDNVALGDVIAIVNHPEHVAYVSIAKVISQRDLFLSGEGVRQQVTPEIERRRTIVSELKTGNINSQMDELKKSHVEYLYFYKNPSKDILKNDKLRIVFENSAATILKIK